MTIRAVRLAPARAATFTDAVVAALRTAVGETPLQVGDGTRDKLQPPYAVAWAARVLDGEGLDQRSDRATVDVSVSSVGATRAAADAVAGRVMAALTDRTLTVQGWSCSPVRHLSSPPTAQDPETTAPAALWVAVDQFRFTATRG